MVSIENKGEGAAFYTLELKITVGGQEVRVLGGDEVRTIERGEQAGLEYPVDLSSIPEGEVRYSLLVKYGSSKKSLEEFAKSEGPLTTISYKDDSSVAVQAARYDSENKRMLVTIKNNGTVKAYVYSKLTLIVQGELTNVSGSGSRAIDPGSLIVEEFPLALTQSDLSANKNVTVHVDYGGREGFLVKKAEFVANLEKEEQFPFLLVAALIVVILVAYFAFRQLKK
jgi:hypothetical protein